VKTSTGFGAGGATVADVRLLKALVGGRAKVKASGGIRDWKTTREMLEAGADRIGTSASLKIMEEWSAARQSLRSQDGA
jgi:deoxyribose-phosphate aldolase